MVSSKLIKKDLMIRHKFKVKEFSRKILKYLLHSQLANDNLKKRLSNQLYGRRSRQQPSFIKTKNRCLITGRSRYVFRSLGLCRHEFKRKALEGFLPGIGKGSW